MGMPIWTRPMWNDNRNTNALPQEQTTPITQHWGKKEITCPYCNKTYCAKDRLLTHIELSPQKGNRNAEICPNLKTEDAPREKGIRAILKMKGNMYELRPISKKSPIDTDQIIRMAAKVRLQQQEKSTMSASAAKKQTSQNKWQGQHIRRRKKSRLR